MGSGVRKHCVISDSRRWHVAGSCPEWRGQFTRDGERPQPVEEISDGGRLPQERVPGVALEDIDSAAIELRLFDCKTGPRRT